MRTCAIFTRLLVFFVYDLELFIDVCIYKRHNFTPPPLPTTTTTTPKHRNDASRSKNWYVTLPKMSVLSLTSTREEMAVNIDLFICN